MSREAWLPCPSSPSSSRRKTIGGRPLVLEDRTTKSRTGERLPSPVLKCYLLLSSSTSRSLRFLFGFDGHASASHFPAPKVFSIAKTNDSVIPALFERAPSKTSIPSTWGSVVGTRSFWAKRAVFGEQRMRFVLPYTASHCGRG